jgi:hypothetical protein
MTNLNGEPEITLEMLLPYRDFMDLKQIQRYGDYVAHRKPSEPFTLQEINELKKKREVQLNYHRRVQAEIMKNHQRK